MMRTLGVLAACMLGAFPVLADPITIPTAQGPVELPGIPEKVAVYDVTSIDTMEALGVLPAAVPDKLYVDFLEDAAAGAARAGTLFEPDLERLAAVGPDLVILGMRSARQAEAVSPLAPVIDMSVGPDAPESARQLLAAYGVLFDREEKATELIAALDNRLEEAQAAVKNKGKALIVLTNGPKISAFGEGSRFGWLHKALHIPMAYQSLKPAVHGDAISFEFIVEVNPDWLLVVDRGAAVGASGASAKETLDNPLVAQTVAWQKGQVVYLDAARIYVSGGGYQSVMGTLEEIITAFSD